jgi:polyisoprenoid-binding protein YceI
MKPLSAVLASTALALGAAAAHAETVTYTVDPSHTFVYYESLHFATSTNRGRFPVRKGTVQIDRAAKNGKAEIEIDVAGVRSGVPALDKHLQGTDFFDTTKYPIARFVAERFAFDGDKVASLEGQLTLRGKTLPVTLKATRFNCYQSPMIKREVCGGDFAATIKRSLWGVDFGLDYGFPDETPLSVQIEATRQ